MAKVTLTKEQTKRLNALGVSTKSEDAARKGLIKLLAENDIDGMDDEDIDTLLDLAESVIEPEGAGAEAEEENEEETSTEETEAEELAEEAEEEAEEETEEEEEETEEAEEGDEFDEMDRSELKKYIKSNNLDVKVLKNDSDDDLRDKIRAAVAESEGEEEEAEEEKAPAKSEKKAPAAKKAATAPAKKAATAKTAEKKPSKRGVKLDPQNNPEDLEFLKEQLSSVFPEDEFVFDAVKSAGVTVKHKGQNSKRGTVLIENCSRQADGSVKCNLYFLTLTKNTDVLEKAEIEYEVCWNGAPFVKGTTLTEAVSMIDSVKEFLTAQVKKIDKKLGENRAKMEEGLAKKSVAAKSAAAAKKPAAAPAKKPAAAPAKKVAKKK